METTTTPTQAPAVTPAGSGSPTPGFVAAAHSGYVKGCNCPKCEEKRARWRDKSRARSTGGTAEPSPGSGPKISALPPVASPTPTPDAGKPRVPWTPDLIRPLLQRAANLAEKLDGQDLLALAREISPQVEAFMLAKVAWDAEAKGALVDSGAEVAAKWFNKFGVSAEYAPEVNFGLAGLFLVHQRTEVRAELRKMADEMKAARVAKSEPEKKAA